MRIARSRWSGIPSQLWPEGSLGAELTDGPTSSAAALPFSTFSSPTHPFSPACGHHIEHRVSKMDTLAGVAIKYGVEVADIKRMNTLVTDLQMFAHKYIKIPLPGRHPPSSVVTNGASCNGDQSLRSQPSREMFEPFKSPESKAIQHKVTPAMSSLQGYYGLVTPKRVLSTQGTEMAICSTGRTLRCEDELLPSVSATLDPHSRCHCKSKGWTNGFSLENRDSPQVTVINDENGEIDRSSSEKSIRRRPKADADLELMTEDDWSLSLRNGKTLAPRPKSGSRTDLDSTFKSSMTTSDIFMTNGFVPVRKSSSTSNLQEADISSSLWPTSKWSLKPDTLAKPLFDGLPKPIAARRNKAAKD